MQDSIFSRSLAAVGLSGGLTASILPGIRETQSAKDAMQKAATAMVQQGCPVEGLNGQKVSVTSTTYGLTSATELTLRVVGKKPGQFEIIGQAADGDGSGNEISVPYRQNEKPLVASSPGTCHL